MNFKSLAFGITIMALMTMLWVGKDIYHAATQPRGFYIEPGDASQVAYGRSLYVSYCAACHGSQLQGQTPNWREPGPNGRLPAPPHDESGHTWHHSDSVLFDITRNGMVPGRTAPPGHASDMPAYAGILSDAEIIAVLAYIKSTWPADILALQHEVNQNEWSRAP